MIVGYLDESGHSASTAFVSIAAFVAEADCWLSFDSAWRALLERTGAPHLHMREFAHRRGAFEGWSENHRRQLLGGAIEAINGAKLTAIGAVTAAADFRALSKDEQSMFQDPFFSCFQEVVRGVGIHAEGTPDNGAQVVFSRQDDFGSMARKLWDSLLLLRASP